MKSPDFGRFLPIVLTGALATTGAAVLLDRGTNPAAKPVNSSAPKTHTEIIVGACPPGYRAPWEQPAPNNPGAINESGIVLASVVRPQPTPDRNPVECFYKVEVPGPGVDTSDTSTSMVTPNSLPAKKQA